MGVSEVRVAARRAGSAIVGDVIFINFFWQGPRFGCELEAMRWGLGLLVWSCGNGNFVLVRLCVHGGSLR